MANLTLHVQEHETRHGYFMAWILNPDGITNEYVFPHSQTPFLSAARTLIKQGLNPNTILTMVHARTGTQSLSSPIGAAAKLTVEETDTGPRFREYAPFPVGKLKDALKHHDPS